MCYGDSVMSIIHDALKKTQDKIKGSDKSSSPKQIFNTPLRPGSYSQSQTSSNEKKIYGPKTIVFLTILTLLLFGSTLFYFLYDPAKPHLSATPTTATAPTSRIKTTSMANGQNIEQLVKGIQFQGTASNGTSTAALINDDIYEEGDTIRGLYIKTIRQDEIDLTAGEQSITLHIQ